jgi:hypothetical protein
MRAGPQLTHGHAAVMVVSVGRLASGGKVGCGRGRKGQRLSDTLR